MIDSDAVEVEPDIEREQSRIGGRERCSILKLVVQQQRGRNRLDEFDSGENVL